MWIRKPLRARESQPQRPEEVQPPGDVLVLLSSELTETGALDFECKSPMHCGNRVNPTRVSTAIDEPAHIQYG